MSVIRTLRIGMQGLSLHEDLLLMAMVRLQGSDGKKICWEYVSEQACDVVIKDANAPLSRRVGQPALHVNTVRHEDEEPAGLILHFPLRVAAVAVLLKQLEQRLAAVHVAPDIAHAALPTPVVDKPVSTPAHLFAEQLQQEIQACPDVLELGLPGQPPLLVIECWRKQFFLPAEHAPALHADAWVPLFTQLANYCEIRRRNGTRSLHMASPAPRRTLDRLLWKLGAIAAGSELLSWLPANGPYQLRRWPDFGALGTQPRFIKLAALMVRQALTLDELVDAGQVPRGDVVAFINGCALCGLLQNARAPQTTVQSARPVVRAPAAGMRGLLGRIRSALHLG